LNLRPLGPEPTEESVPPLSGLGTSSQALDTTGVVESHSVEDLPRDAPNGAGGEPFQGQVAADLRRTKFELLRPEDLLPVTAAAQLLGVSVATVHNAINAGKLRYHLFGTARRVRPEDLDAYGKARVAERPPAGEDWRTVRDLMRAAEVSRSQAYRLLDSGVVPFQVFAGVRYVRGKDIAAVARSRRKTVD
jgi:excisionase family DNA binding protein